MAQNITLLGASYSDVPSVELPKTGGGTAQFDDTTIASNAASASDITSGKLAFVNGELVTGTASGGGGGGLEYETGTWSPANDTASYTIQFAKTHTTAPYLYSVFDATGSYLNKTYTNQQIIYFNFHQLFGSAMYVSSTSLRYGIAATWYRAGNATSVSNGLWNIEYPYTDSGDSSSTYSRYWATETGIKADTNNTSRYWRAGRTYKWIAIWTPTS